MIRLALTAFIALASCQRSPPPVESSAASAETSAPTVLSPGQVKKLEQQLQETSARVPLPDELADRVAPAPVAGAATLDLYRDGKRRQTVGVNQLEGAPRDVESLLGELGRNVRSVLIHGESGNVWIGGDELDAFRVRLNRRGLVKFEPTPANELNSRPGGGGRAKAKAKADAPAHRPREVRGVQWIEVRSRKSPMLSHEPNPI